MKFACEFWKSGADCGCGLCPQYEGKQNCVVEATLEEMADEPGYYRLHEVVR